MSRRRNLLHQIRRVVHADPDQLAEALALLDEKEGVALARLREHRRLADEEISRVTRRGQRN